MFLHVEALEHHDVLLFSSKSPDRAECADWVSQEEIKAAHFDPARRGLYHYVVMGHMSCGSAHGTGEGLGDDIVLQVASEDEAGDVVVGDGAMFHELGHNLGLGHGGRNSGTNRKPNYQSSMNYLYGGGMLEYDPGVPVTVASNRFDYLSGDNGALEEWSLDEGVGVVSEDGKYWVEHDLCVDAETGLRYPTWYPPNAPVDWDCDGDTSGVGLSVDLTGNGGLGELTALDDWNHVDFRFVCREQALAGNAPPEEEESDPEDSWRTPLLPAAELAPACPEHAPIASDGSGEVQLVVYGSAELDVGALRGVTLAGADPTASGVSEEGSGAWADAVYVFAVGELEVGAPEPKAVFQGHLTDGTGVFGEVLLEWEDSAVDVDGDGVDDRYGCDACPGVAGGAASADGCP